MGQDPFQLHHLLPLLLGSLSFLGMYVVLFWAKVRAAFSWLKKLFRSRRQ
jgi:hypothetical protein